MERNRKIIIIGELGVDIEMTPEGIPGGIHPGGRLLNAAVKLGRRGEAVEMVGDMGSDPMGDIVMRYLTDNNVATRSVDCYTDGLTPVTFHFGDRTVRYAVPPADGFDVVWPRIEPGDIVVLGGYYAIDPRVRPRLSQLIANAVEMRAMIVYLPGFLPELAPRITKVMPSLLENMEVASMVITRTADLCQIYGDEGLDPVKCYRDHVFYYAPSMVNVDAATGRVDIVEGLNARTAHTDLDVSTLDGMAEFVAEMLLAVKDNTLGNTTL